MTAKYGHWISGRSVPPASSAYFAASDPRTGQIAAHIALGTRDDIELAVRDSAAAQPEWARLGPATRSRRLLSLADLIDEQADELVALERAATGKVEVQARGEVEAAADYFRYYGGIIRSFHGRTIDQGPGSHTSTHPEPYGVIGVITPWNYPLNGASRAVAPALAAGNAVVVKPSEHTSTSTLLLASIAVEAGLPAGILNVVTGTGDEAGRSLVAHAQVGKVSFTGSVATGRRIAWLAAERLIPLTLELGGKSPLVIFADADLERAVAAAVRALVTNAGQVCSATTRLLVEEPVHDEFIARVADASRSLAPGVEFGPMITRDQYQRVCECFAAAQRAGMTAAIGGTPYEDPPGGGWYVPPTVYSRVSPESFVAREEIFGPVLATLTFSGEAAAVELANDSEYGLVASVWSNDVSKALRVASRLQAGQVAINGGRLSGETPFGGYKLSGYGREKGLEALHEYTQIKTVSIGVE
jgi:acyl-CoA reductase-like NAD-dependent aldehyde dehydrogenase